MTKGERIKAAREGAKLTQSELGALCGTTKQTIYKYENDITTNIPIDRLEKIAQATNVTAAYLMGWDDDTETILRKAAREKVNSDSFLAKPLEEQNFLLSVSEAEENIIACYRIASPTDRSIVDLALEKYRENPARSDRSAG